MVAPGLDDLRAKLQQDFDRLEKHLRGLGAALRLERGFEGELIASALLKSNAQLLCLGAEALLNDFEALRALAVQASALAAAQSSGVELEPLARENAAHIQAMLARLNADNLS